MRFGLVTPVVTRHPDHDAPWTEDAGPAEIAAIAVAADRLGYHHLTCSEHVAIPTRPQPRARRALLRPARDVRLPRRADERIRFVTHVLVLGYHHPLAIAKRYGTLDRLSGGRLDPRRRRRHARGGVRAARRASSPAAARATRTRSARSAPRSARREPALRRRRTIASPTSSSTRAASRRDVPIWLGGRTPRSLRRALEFGDGWDPFGLGLERLTACSARPDVAPGRRGPGPFDLVLPIDLSLDPPTRASGASCWSGLDATGTSARRSSTCASRTPA